MNSPGFKQKSSPQSWDDNDDKLLVQLKEREHLGWKQIAKYFDNRTSNACQFRWRRLKSGQLKKVTKAKRFTERSHDITASDTKFSSSGGIPSPSVNLSNPIPWTTEEDNLIRSRVSKKLSIIELSILLPNKSTSEIENRIHFLERKKLSISSLLTENLMDSNSSSGSTSSLESDTEITNVLTPTRTSSFSSNFSASSLTSNLHFAGDNKVVSHYFVHNQHQQSLLFPAQPLQQQSSPIQYSIYPSLPSKMAPSDPVVSPIHQQGLYPFRTTNNSAFCKFPNSERLPPLSKVYSLLNQ